MAVKINNYSKKVDRRGDYDWYRWKVFVDSPPNVLEQIKEVEYLLHSTFPDPRRVVRDKSTAFTLELAGWGSFDMLVTVRYINGKEERLRYFLDLEKPWPNAPF